MRISDWSSDVCSSDLAHYGPPPEGATFVRHGSHHDFGRYVEIAIRFDPEHEPASTYACQLDEGLGRWFHAGYTAPVEYPDSTSPRSEESRVGTKCVSTCKFWWRQ